jgi:choline kinase
MEMDKEDFRESIMRALFVQKPEEVTQNSLKKIHEDFIMNNLLETIYKWSTITLATNHTDIPFITSDSPVVYNNAEFFPSYLNKEKRIEYSMIFNPDTVNFYFPIDPRYAFIINNFDNKKKEVSILDEVIFDPELVMTMNMLEYQYSERFIYLREINEELVKKIRIKCGSVLNKDYQSMESSYSVIKEEREKSAKLTKDN